MGGFQLTKLSLILYLTITFRAVFAQSRRFELSAQGRDLSTIDHSINWAGCRYKVDQLFLLTCRHEGGMWIADAKSLLAGTNCVSNCPDGYLYEPSLEFRRFGDFLTHAETEQFQVTEFAYSGLLTNATMELNYVDMAVVKELAIDEWPEVADEDLERTYLQTVQINVIDPGGNEALPEVTLGDYYYDLEVTAIQSRSGTLSELNVYESVSDYFKKIVSVRGADGRALHNLDVTFSIVPPGGERGSYTMIVALDSTLPGTQLAVQRYDFTPD